jgi:hypothetical protein
MSLIELAAQELEKFAAYTVEQIVSICGDGKLRDNTDTSAQFRKYLALQQSTKLKEYANYCLEHQFDKKDQKGFILQDIVNEIGRRLGYKVTNGIYQGKSNKIGFDGLWDDGQTELIVEVKTTDAYRINLNTLLGYGKKLNADLNFGESDRPCLIVVGRQDTGDLEAQVRGSRHAWSVRMISLERLIRLMFINEEVDDLSLVKKIRQILLPFEYTRVDNIVDLVFEAQQIQEEKTLATVDEVGTSVDDDEKHAFDVTPKAAIEAKKWLFVKSFFSIQHESFERETKTAFRSESNKTHVVCAISKRFTKGNISYWYAVHPHWLEYLKDAEKGYLIIGGMDADFAYALPIVVVLSLLPKLNQTIKEKEGKSYWHLHIGEANGEHFLNLSKVGEKIPLSPYKFFAH